jgi:hypothetical protein
MKGKDIDKAMKEARAAGNRVRVWTNVSGKRVLVEVGQECSLMSRGGRRMRRYFVTRVDTGAHLPKARTAGSLHCTDGRSGEWPSMTEKQDRPDASRIFERDCGDAPICSQCGATGNGAQFRIFSPFGFGKFCIGCEPHLPTAS